MSWLSGEDRTKDHAAAAAYAVGLVKIIKRVMKEEPA